MVHLDLELEEGAFAARPWIDALKGRGGGEAGVRHGTTCDAHDVRVLTPLDTPSNYGKIILRLR